MKVLKNVKLEILTPLTKLINMAISSGQFPEKLKTAKVTPLFKKGVQHLLNNYRPLTSFSSYFFL